jgi:hypothetical protein
MFNFRFVPDVPGYQELKAQVNQIYELIKAGNYVPFTSVFATGELDGTENREKRERMKALIAEYNIKMLQADSEATRLADLYVAAGAVPPGYPLDALHIALTTANRLDFIVSLNFEHIARPWTVERVARVNAQEGYKAIGIYRPVEVLAL